MHTADWDSQAYHRLSEPQFAWAQRILARIPFRGDETVLDAGCGSGRVTAELCRRIPRGRVLGVDASPQMVATAREFLRESGLEATIVCADLVELPFSSEISVILSTATFHWVTDHPRLFAELHRVLEPGGRLIAQCGGAGNVAGLREMAAELMRTPALAPFFADFVEPWEFATPDLTRERLHAAGFEEVETSLQAAPTPFASAEAYRAFVSTMILRPHLARISDAKLAEQFLTSIVEWAGAREPRFTLDYQRLNLSARRRIHT